MPEEGGLYCEWDAKDADAIRGAMAEAAKVVPPPPVEGVYAIVGWSAGRTTGSIRPKQPAFRRASSAATGREAARRREGLRGPLVVSGRSCEPGPVVRALCAAVPGLRPQQFVAAETVGPEAGGGSVRGVQSGRAKRGRVGRDLDGQLRLGVSGPQ